MSLHPIPMTSPDAKGKVRDIYDLEGNRLLLVASDRISAFDFVLSDEIDHKGAVLAQMSKFWLTGPLRQVVPNHFVTDLLNESDLPPRFLSHIDWLSGRSMIVKKASVLPVECIVRGYITGSGWKSYQQDGTVCGIQLPEGLVESDILPEPIFTPSTKADLGAHDENIAFGQMCRIVGSPVASLLREYSLELYKTAAAYALERGIIIADTKFEFGIYRDDVILIDEVLTPDSSRFWPADTYEPGHGQPSFDKQYVRDYLEELKVHGQWNGESPVPQLPGYVVNQTSAKYLEAFERLTGVPLLG